MKSRNTNKFYYYDNNWASGKLFYNERLPRNPYKKVYTLSDKIMKLSRTYTNGKGFQLTSTVIKASVPASDTPSPFVAVFYQAWAIIEKDDASCHGHATQNSKPYFRTSKDVLQKFRE